VKTKAIIVDLDGTLCNAEHRKHHVETDGKKNWEAFYSNLVHDIPNEWCQLIIDKFDSDGSSDIIFVSGRPDSYRELTVQWLRKHSLARHKLLMRMAGDFRKDSIVKEEIYKEQIEPLYDVLFCIDDRKQVVDMWRSLGLTCLQCAEGDF
jgi:hypothetical protein